MSQASISWLDFSETDRHKMIEVIKLFRERETRDELGIGSIRDAIAGHFFPGTTTLQTRARYFLFIPWLYRTYEERQVPSRKVGKRLKQDEIKLIDALKQNGEDGVIGQLAGANLHRFPSSIYWNGLQRWKVLSYPGHQGHYHRSLDHFYRWADERTDVGDLIRGASYRNWDARLPKAPDTFPKQATFTLTHEEATYLQERIILSCKDSLLATLVGTCKPADAATIFIWQHPELTNFPKEQQDEVRHAQNFAESMHCALLLYNLMLAELSNREEEMIYYRENLQAASEILRQREKTLRSWNQDILAFWTFVTQENTAIPIPTKKFVEDWLSLLFGGHGLPDLASDPQARDLIRGRESKLKGERSRFTNHRHLELWSGASQVATLDFRWRITHRLTNDILNALERD